MSNGVLKARYRTAIGLEYDPKDCGAPVVGIKGEYLSADEIVKIARRYGVPIVEKPALAQALRPVELEQQIPESLFEAVASILNGLDRSSR